MGEYEGKMTDWNIDFSRTSFVAISWALPWDEAYIVETFGHCKGFDRVIDRLSRRGAERIDPDEALWLLQKIVSASMHTFRKEFARRFMPQVYNAVVLMMSEGQRDTYNRTRVFQRHILPCIKEVESQCAFVLRNIGALC